MTSKKSKQQSGIVMLTVLLLIIMFTGLGILAVRQTTNELRSVRLYGESEQAKACAEGTLTLLISDIDPNTWANTNRTCTGTARETYQFQFDGANFPADGLITASLNLNPNCLDYLPGEPPNPYLSGRQNLTVTGYDPSNSLTAVCDGQIVFRPPYRVTPPSGNQTNVENETMEWKQFEAQSTASYGLPPGILENYPRGQATANAQMIIGPL